MTTPVGQRRRIAQRVPGGKVALILLVGLVVCGIVLTFDRLGLLAGPIALSLAALLWLGIPSSHLMSRRLAINGAIALGVIPALWWFPWDGSAPVGQTAAILGVGAGFLASRALWSRGPIRPIIRTLAAVDLLPLFCVVGVTWYFRPLLTLPRGAGAVSALRGAFGNDNVAHFDMFEMTRRHSGSGLTWPRSDDGSLFAYAPYPQHFHSFAVFVSELWGGREVGSVDIEIGRYGIATALTIGFAFVTLVAAVVSMKALRRRFVLSTVVTVAAFSFLFLGLGSTALSYGFPPYLFAILATLIGIVVSLETGVARNVEVFAVGASVVAVAHSWSLLAPVIGIAALLFATRLPWDSYRGNVMRFLPSLAIVLSTGAGLLFAAYLVVSATFTVGSPDAVLATSGAIPVTSVPLTFSVCIGLLGLAALALGRIEKMRPRQRGASAFIVLAAVAAVAVAESAILNTVQLARAGGLDYFQYKFLNAVFLIAVVLLVLGAALMATRSPVASGRISSLSTTFGGVFLAAGIVLASAVSFGPSLGASFSGLQFRHDVYAAAQSSTESDSRLVAAADLMATGPCARPIYLAPLEDDGQMEESNMWAMSLSASWTEAAAPINTYLFSQLGVDQSSELDEIAKGVLDGEPDRCLIVAPGVKAQLAELTPQYDDQTITW